MIDRRGRNIVTVGAGLPTFLFVHGFGCAHDDWSAQLDALSASNRCIAMDLPGHGASAMPPEATLRALGAAVNEVKDETAAREVILVGHSLGAKIVREAYAQSSAGVIGLVMIEGRFYAGDTPALRANAAQAIDAGGFTAFAERFFANMFADDADPVRRDAVLARLRHFDPAFGRALYLDSIGWDAARSEETLAALRVPVLVVQSSYTDAGRCRPLRAGMTTPLMDLVSRNVPGSETAVIPCDHFPMFAAAEAVNAALRGFAARLGR